MQRRPILTRSDFELLNEVLNDYRNRWLADSEILEDLAGRIKTAQIVEDMRLPASVACLNSIVRLRDTSSQETDVFTLVLPEDADIVRGKLTVLAPIGLAILGSRVGQMLTVAVPSGERQVVIDGLLYQPQPASNYEPQLGRVDKTKLVYLVVSGKCRYHWLSRPWQSMSTTGDCQPGLTRIG